MTQTYSGAVAARLATLLPDTPRPMYVPMSTDGRRARGIILVGPLPPPLHGASTITKKVRDVLQAAGADIVTCNTSPNVSVRGWRWHLNRLCAYYRCCRTVLAAADGQILYISLSGGLGLLYDLCVVLLGRMKSHHLIFHHHNSTYINRRSMLFRAILHFAPRQQRHIVLCDEMKRAIAVRYNREVFCLTVSNLCFIEQDAFPRPARRRLRKIGFLSNVQMEKGIDRFIDFAQQLSSNHEIEAHIAGPFADVETEAYVRNRIGQMTNVVYHGPVFAGQKRKFYESIDLFVFLSRYPNEAEPLVLYEAMLAGLPIVATRRGCICDMVDFGMAVLVDENAAHLEPAVAAVEAWLASPETFHKAQAAVAERLRTLKERQQAQLAAFLGAFDMQQAPESLERSCSSAETRFP